jgi:hypothetical protein
MQFLRTDDACIDGLADYAFASHEVEGVMSGRRDKITWGCGCRGISCKRMSAGN